MSLKLRVDQEDNDHANIGIRDENDVLRCDVWVEVYEDKVTLLVTDDIVARDSDEPELVVELLKTMSPAEKHRTGNCWAWAFTFDRAEFNAVLAGLRLLRHHQSGRPMSAEQRLWIDVMSRGEAEPMTVEQIDALIERLN